MPSASGLPSVKARFGSWQEAQLTVPSAERRVSKKSFLPSSTFSAVIGLSAGTKYSHRSCVKPRGIRISNVEDFGESAALTRAGNDDRIKITPSLIALSRFIAEILAPFRELR